MAVSKEHEWALLQVTRLALIARGYKTPQVSTVLQIADEAAKLVGINRDMGAVIDHCVRHIIAEGAIKLEFDHG